MRLILVLILVLIAAPAVAQERPPDFVTIAFHDVVDREEDRDADSTTTIELTRFFDWLKGNGWTPISLDDLDAAQRGVKPLPPKAILLSFDDGYESVYTRVYPLLLAYNYPALVAVVGRWMEGAPGSMVAYGDQKVPRERFLSWEQIREMTGSGLVELASHSYGLHTSVLGNPQGNMQPAGATWKYDPATATYEDDAAYRRRIRADLDRARQQILRETGKAPRALVWPFGRYTGPATEEARTAGFPFIFQLIHAPDRLDQLDQVGRIYPVASDKLSTMATEIDFPPSRADTVRIACLTLDRLAAVGSGDAQDAALGRMIEAVRELGANTLVLDAQVALPSPDAPLGAVFFSTPVRPLASDLLDRVIWQMRTRADIDAVYLRLPFTAARKAVGDQAVATLYADLVRNAAADGLVFDATPEIARLGADVATQPSSTRWDVAARRQAVDAATLTGADAVQWKAYQAATAIKSHLKLMLVAQAPVPQTRWPAPLADILLLPTADATQIASWLDPLQSARVALTLPAGPAAEAAETMRAAQRRGATAFALCPADLDRDPAALSSTFSATTYPLQP
jgi:peptidoglycan/xylan/chitin deacetylase (PgdA/CDA1 family)